MAKKQRTTFAKMQKERARQAKQAEKRERRQSKGEGDQFTDDGEPVFSEAMLGYYPDDIRPGTEAPDALPEQAAEGSARESADAPVEADATKDATPEPPTTSTATDEAK